MTSLIPNHDNSSGLWCLYYGALPQGSGIVARSKPGWNGLGYAAHVQLGGQPYQISSDGGGISDQFTLTPGQYTLAMHWQGDININVVIRVGLDLYDSSGQKLARINDEISVPAPGWQAWQLNVTAPAGTVAAAAFWSLWENGVVVGNVYLSDWQLQLNGGETN